MLKRCKECGGTVAILRTTDERGKSYWIVAGRGILSLKFTRRRLSTCRNK